ncbi:MAG: type II toxin-antitoxin system ParD family antitoxin [Hyphomonadaceae bacterium]|nr:type II toxin-antitoxin system ParD family antitoxin [Hyphomonadaceae bacterium]
MTKPKSPGPGVQEDPQVFSDEQSRESALDELRRLIAEGDASGPSRPYDRDAFMAARRREVGD